MLFFLAPYDVNMIFATIILDKHSFEIQLACKDTTIIKNCKCLSKILRSLINAYLCTLIIRYE